MGVGTHLQTEAPADHGLKPAQHSPYHTSWWPSQNGLSHHILVVIVKTDMRIFLELINKQQLVAKMKSTVVGLGRTTQKFKARHY